MAYKKSYSKKSGADKKKDMFEEATKNLIEIMKTGDTPWSKGRLQLGAPTPSNFNTGKRYRGVNVINLMCISHLNNFSSNYFITYNQSLAVADVTRKDPNLLEKSPLTGQKAVGHVTYWGNITKDKNDKVWFVIEGNKKRTSPTASEIKAQGLKQFWFLRDTAVFGFEQMDKEKVPEKWLQKRNMDMQVVNKDMQSDSQDHDFKLKVEKLAKDLGVKVEHDPYTKFPSYQPVLDKIVMPPISLYENDQRYYHSLFHELIHATGHQSRLERDSLKEYFQNDKSQAYEELVAELGGVFASIELGIKTVDSQSLTNHASYIKGWMKLLTDDLATGNCTTLSKACSDAEKAVDYLLSGPKVKFEKKNEPESELSL